MRQSEERYRQLVQHAPAGIYEIDFTTGRFTEVNDAMCQILGYTRDEILAMTAFDILDDEARALFASRIRVALSGERPDESTEFRVRTKDGRLIWALLNVTFRWKGGKIVGATVVAHDITERKRAEEALRESEERYHNLFNTMDEGFCIIEMVFDSEGRPADYRFLEVNAAFEKQTGLHDAEGRLMRDLTPDHEAHWFEIYGKIALTGEPRRFVNEARALNRWYDVYAYRVGKPEDRQVAILFSDISGHKRAEEELRRSRDELEIRVQERTTELVKANETLRDLSSRLLSAQEEERKRIASEIHDTIGSCLSAAKFTVELAVQQIGETVPGAVESLKTIIPVVQESIDECRRIQTDLRPSILDDLGLLPTLSWFCRRFETIYSGIRVEREVGIEEGEIPAPLKIVIYRITQEAMNNIAKHSGANLVRLSMGRVDGTTELLIRDNGRGFDPGNALAMKSTARGLGLSSMRERTELSGGAFSIVSVVGGGTTIRATWPPEGPISRVP